MGYLKMRYKLNREKLQELYDKIAETKKSDRQLANSVGICQSSMSRLITGQTKYVNHYTALKLEKLFGVNMKEFCTPYNQVKKESNTVKKQRKITCKKHIVKSTKGGKVK